MTLPDVIYFGSDAYRKETQNPAPQKTLGWLKHDYERSPLPERVFVTNPIPQPFRAKPEQTIPVKNYPWIIDLACQLNPDYTRDRAEQWFGPGLCYTNQTWGVFHAPVITGGAVLEIISSGFKVTQMITNAAHLISDIALSRKSFTNIRTSFTSLTQSNVYYFKSILISGPRLTVQDVYDNHLSSIGTSVRNGDRRPGLMTRPDGHRNPDGSARRSPWRMIIPRKFEENLWFPKEDIRILPPGVDPYDDPLWSLKV